MALFGDKKKDTKQKRRFLETPEISPKDSTTTVLAREFRLEGDLTTAGDAVVAGTIEGDLEVGRRLDLLGGGHVHGSVVATEARVEGIVEGPVRISGKLEVGPHARIEGDLAAGTLAIAEGALVRGTLNSGGEPKRFVERRTREPAGDSVKSNETD
jgi:cytoskeletal protein CcmA (bactofilin family)